MRVVGESSADDIARNRVKDDIQAELRELASNLIRIVRGAGKAHFVGHQASAFIKALVALQDIPDAYLPGAEVQQMLSVRENRDAINALSDQEWMRHHALEQIISGALQITASRLLGQTTQEAAGRTEMMNGVAALERVRAEARAKWQHAAQQQVRVTEAGPKRRRPRSPKQ